MRRGTFFVVVGCGECIAGHGFTQGCVFGMLQETVGEIADGA